MSYQLAMHRGIARFLFLLDSTMVVHRRFDSRAADRLLDGKGGVDFCPGGEEEVKTMLRVFSEVRRPRLCG